MMHYWGFGSGSGYGMGGFGPFGLVLEILFWALLIALIVAIIRRVIGGPRRFDHWRHHHFDGQTGTKSALDILNERYAKGEINKEEYEAKKKDLLS